VTLTRVAFGCAKVKVKVAPLPLTLWAGEPLISRSLAFTPLTGSVNDIVICVRLVTCEPAAGLCESTAGAIWSTRV